MQRQKKKKWCYYAEIMVLIGLLEALLSDGSKNAVLMVAQGILSVRRNRRRRARGLHDCGFPDGRKEKGGSTRLPRKGRECVGNPGMCVCGRCRSSRMTAGGGHLKLEGRKRKLNC